MNYKSRRPREEKREERDEFESKLLDLARTSHTRAGGRKIGFRAVIVAGTKRAKLE